MDSRLRGNDRLFTIASNFNPRNIQYIPVVFGELSRTVKIFTFLELEQN